MGVKHNLSIDLETYSSVPLGNAGVYKYVSSDDFEILLLAYSLDGGPVEVIDLAQGDIVPEWLKAALVCENYTKHAYNAQFEFVCLSRAMKQPMIPSQWRCTMFHGLYAGYTAGLEATGRALGLPEDKQKMAVGRSLIRYFCLPCKATKVNGGRVRNLPRHDPDKWTLFKEYNKQDVVTEMEIEKRLASFPVPPFLQKQWETDLIINSRGVMVDQQFTDGALAIGATVREDLMREAVEITTLDNPNSVSQLTQWINENSEYDVENLRKETVSELLGRDDSSPDVQRILEIRQELGKTSTKKYDAIKACAGPDDRIRGLLQFYGANRTVRWAGRVVQVQNLPRTYTEPLELARTLVKQRKKDALQVIYGSVPSTLSQLIRTAFIPSPGHVMIDADFSAIEARVISWLADEEWRLEVFRTHGKIYEASASMIYKVPIETIAKGQPNYGLRQRGKVAELALGYQGGVGAMRRMDVSHALDDMPDSEVQTIVDEWRNANSKIRSLWWEMEEAATRVIERGGSVRVKAVVISREYDVLSGHACLSILLPSGRKLYYINPRIGANQKGFNSIVYDGVEQTSRRWTPIETYGGKLVENVVQAIARDCLADAIERLEAAGYPIVFHVHDEVVIDKVVSNGSPDAYLADVVRIMTQPIPWAPSLPLNADGWTGSFFRKD